jgi:hypothetical protein
VANANANWNVATKPWYGLIDFGEDNAATPDRHYTIPHADALDLIASTGWAWGMFTRLDQNAGTISQYILSSGTLNANPSFNLFIREASVGTPNTYETNTSDATTDNQAQGAQGLVTLGQLRLVVLQYNGTNMTLHICDPGGSASLIATAAGPDGNVIAPGNWHFGRRADGDASRYYQEWAGGLWKADRALTVDEIETIAAGQSPAAVLTTALAGWWPFQNGAVEVEPDMTANGNDATRVGTWPN